MYENNKSDTPDEVASPLVFRLDSKHSYRPHHNNKLNQPGSPQASPKNIQSKKD